MIKIKAHYVRAVAILLGSLFSLSVMAQQSEAEIWGYLGYWKPVSEEDNRGGWHKIDPNTGKYELQWMHPTYGMFGTYFNVGYIRNNRLCGYYGNASQIFYVENNIITGEILLEKDIDVSGDNAIRNMLSGAYNRADDYVYGFALNVDHTVDYFVKAPAADPENVTVVRQMPENFGMLVSCCFCSADNHMYGIDGYGDFIRVDVEGNFEVLAMYKDMIYDASLYPVAGWESGMTYSAKDDAFYWNHQMSDYNSAMVKIPRDGKYKWQLIKTLDWSDQFTIMDCLDTDGAENGPEAPKFVSSKFDGAATSGSVTFTMPTNLANGDKAPASMSWELSSGATPQSGTANAGEEVTVTLENLTPGEVNLKIRAKAGDAAGVSLVHNFWVGYDAPKQPSNVTLTHISGNDFKLKWEAPTISAHRGYFNPDNLLYAVFLDGKQVGVATDKTEVTVQIDQNSETRKYSYQVMAIANEKQSEFARSNSVYVGRGYGIPFYVAPTEEDAGKMYYVNVDNDRSNWRFMTEVGGGPTFYTGRDWDNKGDDWLITPPLYFEDVPKRYNVTFEIKFHNPLKPEEYYEVWLGTAPNADDMREIRIQPKTKIYENTYSEVSYNFDVLKEGTYYLGIRYVGDADQGGIYVRNISISKKGDVPVENVGAEDSDVIGLENSIYFTGNGKADIFTLQGQLISTHMVENSANVNVARGIYLVKFAGKNHKVYVK